MSLAATSRDSHWSAPPQVVGSASSPTRAGPYSPPSQASPWRLRQRLLSLSTASLIERACILSTPHSIASFQNSSAATPGLRRQRRIASFAILTSASRTPVSYTHLRAHETRHDLVC